MEPSRCQSSASESPDESQHKDTASAGGLDCQQAALLGVYICYKYHPNAWQCDTTESLASISLAPCESQDTQLPPQEQFLPGISAQAPWSPFCTHADFEMAKNV
jgi:hypothetical protein